MTDPDLLALITTIIVVTAFVQVGLGFSVHRMERSLNSMAVALRQRQRPQEAQQATARPFTVEWPQRPALLVPPRHGRSWPPSQVPPDPPKPTPTVGSLDHAIAAVGEPTVLKQVAAELSEALRRYVKPTTWLKGDEVLLLRSGKDAVSLLHRAAGSLEHAPGCEGFGTIAARGSVDVGQVKLQVEGRVCPACGLAVVRLVGAEYQHRDGTSVVTNEGRRAILAMDPSPLVPPGTPLRHPHPRRGSDAPPAGVAPRPRGPLLVAEPKERQTPWTLLKGQPFCPFCGAPVKDNSAGEPMVLRCSDPDCAWRWDD